MVTLEADSSIWDVVSNILRPRKRLRPSEWAERHRKLPAGKSPRPGAWRNDFLPWIQPILDVIVEEPWLDGWCFMKPTQVAGTEIGVTLVGYLADEIPNPMGFIASKRDQARKFCIERFEPMILGSPRLRRVFLRGRENRETLDYKPFLGGALYLVGSGSPNDLISNPMAYVFLDELDRLDDFPGMGSAFEIAQQRKAEYESLGRTGIFMWGHPTFPDRGVAEVYAEQSDQREWTLDCPHCDEPFVPRWSQVKIADRDPETARHHCPHCDEVISDAQRWAASTRGRFVSQLEPEKRRKRRFAGFHVSQLCHPRRPLFKLAQRFCACVSESQLQVFFNMQMGEPYTHSQFLVTEEMIEGLQSDRVRTDRLRDSDLTCPSDTRFVTLGVDVQKDAVLYTRIDAWTRNGNDVVLWYGRLSGWAALRALSETLTVPCPDGRELRPAAGGIDWGYKAREVFSFCRARWGGLVWIPIKHAPGVKPSDPLRFDDTVDPDRPELGKLRRVSSCRDHWMDRQLRRLQGDPEIGGSIVFPAGVSQEFRNHMKAARLQELEDEHGHPQMVWTKEKGERDDYLQAGVYSEIAAFLCGLDRIPDEEGQKTRRAAREQKIRRNIRKYGRPWLPSDATRGWM